MVICLQRGADYVPADANAIPSSVAPVKSRMVPAYPGCPGTKAIKRMWFSGHWLLSDDLSSVCKRH